MPAHRKLALKPRKQPRQARAQATVDALFEATIQVLLTDGLPRLTTIRVAERAGASVGTLYQYYPHKQALLFAVLQRHLSRIGEAVRQAAASAHHTSLATMVSTLIAAFVRAKTERLDEASVLYAVAAELDSRELIRETGRRTRAVLAAMLETATDAKFDDLDTVVFMLAGAMAGLTRSVVETGAPPKMVRALRDHLQSVCLGYLEREARPRSLKSTVGKGRQPQQISS